MKKNSPNYASPTKWKLALGLGISLPLILGGALRYFYPPIPDDVLRRARLEGRNPREMLELRTMLAQTEETRAPSDSEWRRVLELYQHPNDHDKLDAMAVMQEVGDRKRQDEILYIARANLQNPNEFLQSKALRLLWMSHAPEWKEEMTKRKGSPNETIRTAAETYLKRGEFLRKKKT